MLHHPHWIRQINGGNVKKIFVRDASTIHGRTKAELLAHYEGMSDGRADGQIHRRTNTKDECGIISKIKNWVESMQMR